ncbi:MAG: hypothetical protein AMXMBFR7_25540 [Planctomycetota bacterium]
MPAENPVQRRARLAREIREAVATLPASVARCGSTNAEIEADCADLERELYALKAYLADRRALVEQRRQSELRALFTS